MSEKQPFEKTLSDLQAIIEELESENLSLDKMVHLFEDGMKLMKICRTQLDEVENRITTLVKENDEFSEKPGIKQS
ncbi:MAG TPA: exodeoxyribonuclease VII small subunit [Candidatus Marinimicrobia bacterium]|jgi:exodeoxyribonuclease VII small subunit|nr:exodeoxyribonuclease VII small subunit [Candidatus Neomarinimicrobiota bacterium]HIB15000.1 exodeoxyribonuclease VII small subunit [Candidatus Neomarinimicrobiota bacterium]HIG50729.1 exodeoxyribonuclease VII small subunit [Candidatus Neomarinimicrobiota bacterium]HIM53371.1 exodeoxyribonuclease VII small subunit [Candidatus Neomarinimicrobiota bacterium]HIN19259.1 exodeoxyribonuclease VII small subunit [Candidatus Neomarinimicrobiota bacterium]|tara:strand:+ start:237 stop:464 length:228 start_codon:yes stop_codon:yes gene_type:complete